jgi:hypothetical protein
MPKTPNPQITVVYPNFDPRGQAADRVRTWTHGQTLARERYRVVVASGSTDTSQEQEVAQLLGPCDELFRVPGACDVTLWNAGAARAGTPWLVFTEGHALADTRCLEALARWIAANPNAEAGNFDVGHDESYLLGRISRRWFDMIHACWRAPGEWPRLIHTGCAIRADLFEAIGGFEPEYGEFAPALLSARLHARRIRIGEVPGAAVLHIDRERIQGHHADTANYAHNELKARSCIDPVFFERYFGHSPAWANQHREQPRVALSMAQAVAAAVGAHPRRAGELAALLCRLAATVLAGVAPRVALHRLAVSLDEFSFERLPLPAAWRWSRYLRAHARVVRLAQLEWIRQWKSRPVIPLASDRVPVQRLVPDTLIGVHALEEHRGRLFRWTEPVALLRLPPREQEYEIRIETAGIRGDPLAAVIAVVLNRRVLPRESLTSDADGTLIIRLPASQSAAAASGLTLICAALAPTRAGSSDTRLLGLPILSIASVPMRARGYSAMAAV